MTRADRKGSRHEKLFIDNLSFAATLVVGLSCKDFTIHHAVVDVFAEKCTAFIMQVGNRAPSL